MSVSQSKKLSKDFYAGPDVLGIARELLGKILVSRQDGFTCSGRIVELEAYAGISDKASHAFGGRRTNRTEIMYASGGVAYVYLCYGIHHLFNVVTGEKDYTACHFNPGPGTAGRNGKNVAANRKEKSRSYINERPRTTE